MKKEGFEGKPRDEDLIMNSFIRNIEDFLKLEEPDVGLIPSIQLLKTFEDDYSTDPISFHYFQFLQNIHSDISSLFNLQGIESIDEWIYKREIFRDKFLEINLVFKSEKISFKGNNGNNSPEKGIAEMYFDRPSYLSNEENQKKSLTIGTKGYLTSLFDKIKTEKETIGEEKEDFLSNSSGNSILKSDDSLNNRLPPMSQAYAREMEQKVEFEKPIFDNHEDIGKYVHSFGDYEPSPKFSSTIIKIPTFSTKSIGVQTDNYEVEEKVRQDQSQNNGEMLKLQETLSQILTENSELKAMVFSMSEKLEKMQSANNSILQVTPTKNYEKPNKVKNFSSNKIESNHFNTENVIDPKTLRKSFVKAGKQEKRKSRYSLPPSALSFSFPSGFRLSNEEMSIIFSNGKSRMVRVPDKYEILVNLVEESFKVKFWPLKVFQAISVVSKLYEGDKLVKEEDCELEHMYPGECKLLEMKKKPEINSFLSIEIYESSNPIGYNVFAGLSLSIFNYPNGSEKKMISLKQKKYLNSKKGEGKCYQIQKLSHFLVSECNFLSIEKDIFNKCIVASDGKEGFIEIILGYDFNFEVFVKCDYPEKALNSVIEAVLYFISNFSD